MKPLQRSKRKIIARQCYAGQSCTEGDVEPVKALTPPKTGTAFNGRNFKTASWIIKFPSWERIERRLNVHNTSKWPSEKNIGYEFHREGLFSEIIADYLHQFVQMKETVYRFHVGTKCLRFSYIPQPTFLKNHYLHCLFQIFCLPITLSQFELKIIKVITNPTIYSSPCGMAGVKLGEVGLTTECSSPLHIIPGCSKASRL